MENSNTRFTCPKEVAFLEGRFLSANQSYLKSFQKAFIDWTKSKQCDFFFIISQKFHSKIFNRY